MCEREGYASLGRDKDNFFPTDQWGGSMFLRRGKKEKSHSVTLVVAVASSKEFRKW